MSATVEMLKPEFKGPPGKAIVGVFSDEIVARASAVVVRRSGRCVHVFKRFVRAGGCDALLWVLVDVGPKKESERRRPPEGAARYSVTVRLGSSVFTETVEAEGRADAMTRARPLLQPRVDAVGGPSWSSLCLQGRVRVEVRTLRAAKE